MGTPVSLLMSVHTYLYVSDFELERVWNYYGRVNLALFIILTKHCEPLVSFEPLFVESLR